MQQKITYAGTVSRSFAEGSELLGQLADLSVSAKQVERVARRIGTERVAERDAEVAAYQALPLVEKFAVPVERKPPDLAVVMADGGRLQILDRTASVVATAPAAPEAAEGTAESSTAEDWEEEKVPSGHWREDKVGLLLTMHSAVSATDPCPDLPPSFVDASRIPDLVRELSRQAKQGEDVAEPAAASATADDPPPEEAVYQPPQVQQRKVLASRQTWSLFAPMVAAAARSRAAGWACYRQWIAWVWQGQVKRVIAALQERQAELGLPEKDDPETSARQVVARALTYLTNQQDKMRYDEYRRQGLPITSSLMESVVKQVNRRVKGTEKFWSEEGAEALLQLRADQLSDDQPLEAFWQRRQEAATGQRRHRPAA